MPIEPNVGEHVLLVAEFAFFTLVPLLRHYQTRVAGRVALFPGGVPAGVTDTRRRGEESTNPNVLSLFDGTELGGRPSGRPRRGGLWRPSGALP